MEEEAAARDERIVSLLGASASVEAGPAARRLRIVFVVETCTLCSLCGVGSV